MIETRRDESRREGPRLVPFDPEIGDDVSGLGAPVVDGPTDGSTDADVPASVAAFDEPAYERTPSPSPTPLRRRAKPAEGGGIAAVLPFRRPAGRKIRRLRRHLLVRLAKPAAIAILLVGVPLCAVAWLLSAPELALSTVELRAASVGDAGEPKVSEHWVRGTLAPFEGVNLWRLDLAAVESALRRHPWIDRVDLTKRPPSTLVVRVGERREAALWRGRDGLVYVDAAGAPIVAWTPTLGVVDLPIVSGAEADLPAALDLVRELEQIDPAWLTDLSEIEILGERDVRLHGKRLPFPVIVRPGTLAEQTARLDAILPSLLERWDVAAVDLRFSRRIVVRPKGEAGEATPVSLQSRRLQSPSTQSLQTRSASPGPVASLRPGRDTRKEDHGQA